MCKKEHNSELNLSMTSLMNVTTTGYRYEIDIYQMPFALTDWIQNVLSMDPDRLNHNSPECHHNHFNLKTLAS